jgi:hypothetical protein
MEENVEKFSTSRGLLRCKGSFDCDLPPLRGRQVFAQDDKEMKMAEETSLSLPAKSQALKRLWLKRQGWRVAEPTSRVRKHRHSDRGL